MIYAENGNFLLETAHTTYAFCVDPAGNLQHLYYGEKLSLGGFLAEGIGGAENADIQSQWMQHYSGSDALGSIAG